MKIKTLSVEHIQDGTFCGGEEDAWNLGVHQEGAGPWVVVDEKDLKALIADYEEIKWRMEGLEK